MGWGERGEREKPLASRCRGFSREGKPEESSNHSRRTCLLNHMMIGLCVCVCAGTWSGTNKEVERRDRRCFSSSPAWPAAA